MRIKLLILIGIMAAVSYGIYFSWNERGLGDTFECRAILVKEMEGTCRGDENGYGTGKFYFLLSMYGKGQGYLMVSGAYACPGMPERLIDNKIQFSVQRKGSYYALRTGDTPPELKRLFSVFTNPEVIIKITDLAEGEALVSLPFDPPLVCKKE